MTVHNAGMPRWLALANELGGVIGRSSRPVCFVIGAGCSLTAGAPTTASVETELTNATQARFAGHDIRDVIDLLPEAEKQDILLPLFSRTTYNVGYLSLAALATRRSVFVINLNWDTALNNACRRLGVETEMFDLGISPSKWPRIDPTPRLYDIHVHGIIGESCRFGRLETLTFTDAQDRWLRANCLSGTTVITGASLTNETDFSVLFHKRAMKQAAAASSAAPSQWFFIREQIESHESEHRARIARTGAQPFTTERSEDVDFDTLAAAITDRALGIMGRIKSR